MAELADAPRLGRGGYYNRGGSSPSKATIFMRYKVGDEFKSKHGRVRIVEIHPELLKPYEMESFLCNGKWYRMGYYSDMTFVLKGFKLVHKRTHGHSLTKVFI